MVRFSGRKDTFRVPSSAVAAEMAVSSGMSPIVISFWPFPGGAGALVPGIVPQPHGVKPERLRGEAGDFEDLSVRAERDVRHLEDPARSRADPFFVIAIAIAIVRMVSGRRPVRG